MADCAKKFATLTERSDADYNDSSLLALGTGVGCSLRIDGNEHAASDPLGERSALLWARPPEAALGLRIMTQHDQVDRQPFRVHDYLIQDVAGYQKSLRRNAALL